MFTMYLRLKQGIILKKVVAPIAMMASKAMIHFADYALCLRALEPDSNIMVVLHLHSEIFNQYLAVIDSGAVAEINPKELDSILDLVGDGAVYMTTNNDDDRLLELTFVNHHEDDLDPLNVYRQVDRRMRLNEVTDKSTMLVKLQYESESTVGIPSAEFCGILTYLSFFGNSVLVSITNNQLRLSAMTQEIVLTQENGQCTIAGVAQYERIQFSFGLEHMAAFMAASVLSSTVWILTPALPGSPVMLRCPVGELSMALGEVRFFFLSMMTKIEEYRPRTLNLFPN